MLMLWPPLPRSCTGKRHRIILSREDLVLESVPARRLSAKLRVDMVRRGSLDAPVWVKVWKHLSSIAILFLYHAQHAVAETRLN